MAAQRRQVESNWGEGISIWNILSQKLGGKILEVSSYEKKVAGKYPATFIVLKTI